MERTGNTLDGDIAGGAFDVCGGVSIWPLLGGFQIALESLAEGHAAERGVHFVVLRGEFDVQWSSSVSRHGSSLLSGGFGDEDGETDRDKPGGHVRSLVHSCIAE